MHSIMLDPRLQFPDLSEEFFLVQPLLKKSIRVLNGFLSWRGYNDSTVLSMLIRGMTITLKTLFNIVEERLNFFSNFDVSAV